MLMIIHTDHTVKNIMLDDNNSRYQKCLLPEISVSLEDLIQAGR